MQGIVRGGRNQGDYNVGDVIREDKIRLDPTASTAVEVWSKTDISNAHAVVVDTDGNVYVAYEQSSQTKNVRKLDSDGNEIWSKIDVGYAYSIDVDSTHVYVAHSVNAIDKPLRALDKDTGIEAWAKADLAFGKSIKCSPVSSNVHFTCSGYIRKLTFDGNIVWTKSGGESESAIEIVVDNDDNLYCIYANGEGVTTKKFNSVGTLLWSKSDVTGGAYPSGIGIDLSNNCCYISYQFTANRCFRKLDSAGNELWYTNDSNFSIATGIAVGNDSNVYIARPLGSKFCKLDQYGTILWKKAKQPWAIGIALDTAGDVYIAYDNEMGIARFKQSEIYEILE